MEGIDISFILPRSVLSVAKNLLVKLGAIVHYGYVGIPYGMIQSCRTMHVR